MSFRRQRGQFWQEASQPARRSSRAMADLQERIQNILDDQVASEAETGLAAAVYRHGRLVADAVSGVADPASGVAVTSGTLFFATSTAKGIASSLAHVLAERGELDYD